MGSKQTSTWQWSDLAPALTGADRQEMRAEMEQEARGKIALVGLAGVGKSTLYNRLRGWEVSPIVASESDSGEENLGVFHLIDLPAAGPGATTGSDGLGPAGPDLTDVNLIVFVLDASVGVRPQEYAWLGSLRSEGYSVVAVLNKVDLIVNDGASLQKTVEERIGMRVIAMSAQDDADVADRLIRAALRARPEVALALGRDLPKIRRMAAQSVILRAALWSALAGASPLPVVDLALQVTMQQRMLMRLGTIYNEPLGDLGDLVGPVATLTIVRLIVMTALKLVPVIGWIVSGVLSGVATLTVGWALTMHYEGKLDPAAVSSRLPHLHRPQLPAPKETLRDTGQRMRRGARRLRPAWRVRIERRPPDEVIEAKGDSDDGDVHVEAVAPEAPAPIPVSDDGRAPSDS
ncbi:MAG: DUF697 domain-containing protein [Anaerolineae bacterium]